MNEDTEVGRHRYDWNFNATTAALDEYETGKAERADTTLEQLVAWYEEDTGESLAFLKFRDDPA